MIPYDPIDNLRIATPCPASWDRMEGDERVRHCAVCSLNVYNFAEMTRDEARALLAQSEGRLCVRLYRRADGTVLTRDCPTGLRALRRRASRAAAAIVTALLSLPAFALGAGTSKTPRVKIRGSKVELTTEPLATPQPAVFTGMVVLEDGPLPGATVIIHDEASGRAATAVTDNNGAFTITSLSDGTYRVELTLSGLKPATIAHLELKSSVITHAKVEMRIDTEHIIVGAIAVEPFGQDGISTTFTQSFIDKLP